MNNRLFELLKQLSTMPPAECNGWHRWMHHGFHGRMWRNGNNLFAREEPHVEIWREIESTVRKSNLNRKSVGELIAPMAELHAHSLGMASPAYLTRLVWLALSPGGRGLVFAAATHRLPQFQLPHKLQRNEKLYRHIKRAWQSSIPMHLDADNLTQVICNLIAANSLELLPDIMDRQKNWSTAKIGRNGLESADPDDDWAASMAPLSPRAIDRCLEASVRIYDAPAAKLCLDAGADPNLNIFRLERSYNERYSALSHSIGREERAPELVSVLLDAGADPRGTEYEGSTNHFFSRSSKAIGISQISCLTRELHLKVATTLAILPKQPMSSDSFPLPTLTMEETAKS